MKPKAILKLSIDILMTAALLFMMGYQFWGDIAHEWAGVGIFVLFIAHNLLNLGWYKSLFKGKYTPYRIFHLIINLMTILSMLGLMVSSVILSNHAFGFLHIRGGMSFARLLHMCASHWGFVAMSSHIGVHWTAIMAQVKKGLKIRQSDGANARKVVLPIIAAAIAAYGITVFVRRGIITYMLVRLSLIHI